MEANGRLQGSNKKCLWPERRVEAAAGDFRRNWRLANGRLERPNNRGPWTGFKTLYQQMLVARAPGRSCRGGFLAFEGWQTAGLNALTTERGPWRQTAGFRALTTYACGQSAWSKLPRDILGIWGLANGRLERPNNREKTMEANGRLQGSNNKCLWPFCMRFFGLQTDGVQTRQKSCMKTQQITLLVCMCGKRLREWSHEVDSDWV